MAVLKVVKRIGFKGYRRWIKNCLFPKGFTKIEKWN